MNWETPQVHPLDITDDGALLLAVNTADDRLEVFDLSSGSPVPSTSIPVGLDPVSVRARGNDEAWVVNQISDSVSVVDLTAGHVVATLDTADEPADVVFAADPVRAYVSCSQANEVHVFDPADLDAPPEVLEIKGEDPRALAVSADGNEVYVAVFESGNGTTILGGSSAREVGEAWPPKVVSHPQSPYGGENPPPNDGDAFDPPLDPDLPAPPRVGLIVRTDADGLWRDDNGTDWTHIVSGEDARLSGRPPGWDLLDHDLAIIDTATAEIRYATRLLNACMALAVHPTSGEVAVVGTDGINEVRFMPNLNGRFVRVEAAFVTPADLTSSVVDLNPHLDYTTPSVDETLRAQSLGDPRGIAWTSDGLRGYVTGMGSNNVVAIEPDGTRSEGDPVAVGAGPTGIVIDEARARIYVLNRFAATVSVVDLETETELEQVAFYDPTPEPIRAGRPFLYDTQLTSGTGHISCASCHIDARWDRLAWDLGNPAGAMKSIEGQNIGMNLPLLLDDPFEDWHPMKGPMVTQTLQDIIGKEPFHWRGDRDGIEEFNLLYVDLQGDDTLLTPEEMQSLEDFLATIYFPPNPFRNFDNSLPTDLPLPEIFTFGKLGPPGEPVPNGDATRGIQLYRPPPLAGKVFACTNCHTLGTGLGSHTEFDVDHYEPIPLGPNGENHLALVANDGLTNKTLKVPQLMNLYEKIGFDMHHLRSRAGFGYIADGSFDTVLRFLTTTGQPASNVEDVQEIADLIAFLMAYSGGDLPVPDGTDPMEPPGPVGRVTRAAVGAQVTVRDAADLTAKAERLSQMLQLADAGTVDVVARMPDDGVVRGFVYEGSLVFQSDRADEQVGAAVLANTVGPGAELTVTVVPLGSGVRLGVDRDEDGHYDGDERDAGTDPADPDDFPAAP